MLRNRSVQGCAALLAVASLLGACKGDARVAAERPRRMMTTTTTTAKAVTTLPTAPVPRSDVPAPTRVALLALANGGGVNLYANAGDAKVMRKLGNPTIEGMPLAMFAVDQQGDWLQVRYPERPNGTLAWVRASEVTLSPVENRIVVSIAKRSVRLLDKNQQVIYETNVAVGKPGTPTPLGRFFVDIWLPNPGAPYGKFMLSVAGFSEVLKSFGGGRGQIALHGWSDPSAMGRNVSNGCIRMRNDDIVKLSQLAPLGTPVDIVA